MQPLYPRLRASKSVSRQQVRADQARRLMGAMIEAVCSHGYEATTVDQLVALAGVSTRALYDVFGSKLACFHATCEHILTNQARSIALACNHDRGSLSSEQRMQLALDAFVTQIVEQPRASRLALAEPLYLGAPADALVRRGEATFEQLLLAGLCQGPHEGASLQAGAASQQGGLPLVIVRAIQHSLWSLARRALHEGREQQLRGAGHSLLRWLLALRPPASEQQRLLALTSARRSLSAASPSQPALAGAARQPLESERARALHACALIAAREGCAALTWTRIARHSAIGTQRLHELFTSPHECFAAAVEMLSASALARALRRAGAAESWPASVCLALDSFYCQAAGDPVFARLCFEQALATGAGDWPLRRGALFSSFAHVLAARAPAAQAPDPRTSELITGAVWGIARHEVLAGRARSLPSMTAAAAYVTLAPILGAAHALDAVSAWAQTEGAPGESDF